MSEYPELALSKTRDVQALSSKIAELAYLHEDLPRIRAVFRTKRYGAFSVEGIPTKSDVLGGLQVAGYQLESKLVPDKTLHTVAHLAAASVASDELNAELLQHGDLVRAWLTDPHYGSFVVTGQALQLESSDTLVVGGWFIRSNGSSAPRVSAIVRLETVGNHNLEALSALHASQDEPGLD